MPLTARRFGPWVEVTNDFGDTCAYGNRDSEAPQDIILTGEKFETTTIVADDFTRIVLWQDGDAGVAAFDLALFETTADILIELAIDRAGTPTYGVLTVEANRPLCLTSDEMVNAVLTDGSATTMDLIDQIAVKRNVADGVGDATVHMVLWD